ncbi:MAG TPA: hybrid sensor histidine kinase/response regulator [Vicinamibacterales bacterium]|nr:hybrid sensor histidine kinase/response regulator [Vicinamibacterales bacterium]
MGTPDAYPFPTLPAPVRFAVALAVVGIVYLIDNVAGALVDDGSHFLLLGTAVMASAWFVGTGPALAATVVGALLGAREVGDPQTAAPAAHAHLALFVIQGLLLTALVSELRGARRVAEYQAREAQEARREGEAANRMKDEFLATVSHELRTPLNAVLGWVHLLRTGKLDHGTAARGLEAIERNVRVQAQLTADLLDVSIALTGKLQLDTRPVSVTEAVRQAASAVLSTAQAKGVAIVTSVPDASLMVLGDPARLRQIVWHLLANAIKFTPRGGQVAVQVIATPDQARVTVTDSGPGIDPAFLPRVFDRFTQEDTSPTRTVGGLGVGLSLVRDLVELHGGEIDACNRVDGAGAVFTATFPLHAIEAAEPGSAPVMPAALSAPPLDGLRVLILDQDSESRELLRTLLQQHGALVRAVGSVAEALEGLEAWRPDVLLSDSGSPDHDGYAIVGKVHSLEAEHGGRIPALALTTLARKDTRVRQMLEAVQRHLPKPVEPAVLTAEIARISGRERRRAQR